MRITDVALTMFAWEGATGVAYGAQNPARQESRLGLLTIATDDGVVGESFLGASYRSAELDAWSLVDTLKPALMGQDPLDRTRLHEALLQRQRGTTLRAIGAVDVALWDLAGKVAGLPVHRLMGTFRDAVPAYASSATLSSFEAYLDEAAEVKEAGYVGYKIHPHPTLDTAATIRLCHRLREAVGPDFLLMHDAAGHYDYRDALRVGRALEEADFVWFEDPLPIEDIWTYVKLCQKLDIQVMATEYAPGGFHAYAPWITLHATDALRGDVAIKGGLTACLESAHLAHAFHMNYEIHHGGNSINNLANLHLALAIPNCAFFEVLLPAAAQQYGLLRDLSVGEGGMMRPLDGPGLGAEIDRERIDRTTVAVLR